MNRRIILRASVAIVSCTLGLAILMAASRATSESATAPSAKSAPAPPAAAESSCESLSTFASPHTTITSAQNVAAGAFTPPQANPAGAQAQSPFKGAPEFCRVAATLKPSHDSDIKIEVWMPPKASWNGKLKSVGNGGWAGTINYAELANALSQGYAAANTDTGHTSKPGEGPDFAVGHPEKLIDFSYRALHEMTSTAKLLVAAYYAKNPTRSYYAGCSTGGRQGLTAVQRFPNDYDGVLNGDPNNDVVRVQGMQVWTAKISHGDPSAYIPPEKYVVIHQAVLQQCDALDGVKDGLIEDPTRCHFDPQVLECKGPDAPSCLTPAQVKVVREIYAGPIDERTGKSMAPGLMPGSELGWAMLSGPKPGGLPLAADTFGTLVYQNPHWDYLAFDPARDFEAARNSIVGKMMNAVNSDLRPFFAHGGKLLMYHGWNDPAISPLMSVQYYESVVETVGGESKSTGSIRLFMLPGMNHCRGGDGPDTFDGIGAVDRWVETGKPPDRIVASHIKDGVADRTRPLCPYPQVAHYVGSGSTDDAASFACSTP